MRQKFLLQLEKRRHFVQGRGNAFKPHGCTVLGLNVRITALGHRRTNHTFTVLLYQFLTQVTKSPAKARPGAPDTTQPTANTTKVKTVNKKPVATTTEKDQMLNSSETSEAHLRWVTGLILNVRSTVKVMSVRGYTTSSYHNASCVAGNMHHLM